MAVSCLQQREVPLVISCSKWCPWGPGVVKPFSEEDDDIDNANLLMKPKPQMRRNQSWGNFSTYAQLTRYFMEMNNLTPHEVDSPVTVMSEPVVPGRRNKKQRQRNLDPNLYNSSNVVLQPVLLGNRPKDTPSKVEPCCLNAASLSKGILCEDVAIEAKVLGTTESVPITTLMIRNLPYNLTQQELLQAMNESGHAGTFDFIYLPHKFREHKNLGFAFVNFLHADAATKFSTEWHHTYRFKLGGIRKPLNISAAAVQGRVANEKAANSHKMGRVKNGFFRPLLLDNSIVTDEPLEAADRQQPPSRCPSLAR